MQKTTSSDCSILMAEGLNWITDINQFFFLFYHILMYWDAPVNPENRLNPFLTGTLRSLNHSSCDNQSECPRIVAEMHIVVHVHTHHLLLDPTCWPALLPGVREQWAPLLVLYLAWSLCPPESLWPGPTKAATPSHPSTGAWRPSGRATCTWLDPESRCVTRENTHDCRGL